MDARLEEKFEMPTKELTVYFNNSRTSDKIRIFEEGLVHFDRMSAFLTIRVPDHIRNIPTEFILSYADPAFSLFQVFIRFVLFVISFIIFISLLLSDFSVKESHISMKLMFYLDLIAIVASNPLYILEYFVESNFLKIVDTTLVQFLVVAVLFTAISIMEMRDNAYEDLKLSWVLKRFIPFGLGFLVFTASSVYSILFSGIEGNMDDSMVKSFSITKVVLLLVYIVAFVFVSIRFKSEFAEEKVLVTVLGCLMFTVITVSEIRTIFSESYGNHHILLLYSLIGAEVYTFFFNYINWPVDMSKLSLEKEDDQKNPEDIVNEGLAEQLVM
ncbi:hypothetical protein GPJ56_006919 [Histomonas meleagridis]|uniref:uncharacterized protein n=1 Tax=Histomonas meleagridis TaxID=135588 RepID=UPI00355ACB7A|nr:hypothetical protein GPJ56_006919 [Histomonas meleagridis]KAH0800286.1 hypothetical protein GO595_006875 [Histomonas meleagridis]